MTRNETKKILNGIMMAFPKYKIPELNDSKDKDISMATDLLFFMLKDYEYNVISNALKMYISTETRGYAPSIGQLIDCANKIENSEPMSGLEAWSLVSSALRDGMYHSVERFNELPPLIQKAVGSADNIRNWATSDSSSVETVIQSNFLKNYDTICKREREFQKLPMEIKQMIAGKIKENAQIADKSKFLVTK